MKNKLFSSLQWFLDRSYFPHFSEDWLSGPMWSNPLNKWKIESNNLPSKVCSSLWFDVTFKTVSSWAMSVELLWFHHRSPSYIPAVCGHHKWVFGGNFFYFPKSCVTISVTDCFLSFCLILFILLSLLFPCQSSSSSISVQAAKLQWSLDEKLGGSRGTRVSRPFMCVCVLCVALLSGLAVGNI